MKYSKLLLVACLGISLLMTACKKDDDVILENDDVIVGLWDVHSVYADAYVSGFKIENIAVKSEGTLEFKPDFTGVADFTLEFMGDLEEARGKFSWKRQGFELIVSMGDDEIRYAVIDDQPDLQNLQYTDKEEDSDDEVELTFQLLRLK